MALPTVRGTGWRLFRLSLAREPQARHLPARCFRSRGRRGLVVGIGVERDSGRVAGGRGFLRPGFGAATLKPGLPDGPAKQPDLHTVVWGVRSGWTTTRLRLRRSPACGAR